MGDHPFDDAFDREVASDDTLRAAGARARHAWRTEEDRAALDAYVAWRHARSLDDALREHMARGDRVEVRVHGNAFTGVVVDLADDLVSVRDGGAPRVDVRRGPTVPIIVRTVERAIGDGRVGGGDDGGFRARVHANEAASTACRVHLVGEAEPRVATVAPGAGVVHLAELDGTTSVVAWSAIVAIESVALDGRD